MIYINLTSSHKYGHKQNYIMGMVTDRKVKAPVTAEEWVATLAVAQLLHFLLDFP